MSNHNDTQNSKTTNPNESLTLKQVYHKIFAVANEIQGLRYLLTVPSVDISNTSTKESLDKSLKSNFQSLADCIKYLENQFEHGLTEDHFRLFKHHNPQYKPGIPWSELSFLNETYQDEHEHQNVEETDGSTSSGSSYPRAPVPGLYDSDESE